MERSVNDRNKQWTKTLPPSNGRVKTWTAEGGEGGEEKFCRDCPYKILKRKSIEKKLTCFVCGFVLRFLKLLFYAKQHCFALRETHYINSQPFFLRLSILNAVLAILEAQIFPILQGSVPLDPLETSHLQRFGYCAPNLKLTLRSLKKSCYITSYNNSQTLAIPKVSIVL